MTRASGKEHEAVFPAGRFPAYGIVAGLLLSGLPAWSDSAEMTAGYMDTGPYLADRIIVRKSEHKLLLMKDGEVMKSYTVSLGLSPQGHKQQEGDFRTPEGTYFINGFNANSKFFLSIQISYPDTRDRVRAERDGVRPGGQIMIHGLPNEPTWPESHYKTTDWTDGCIAVTNSDMVEIWLMTTLNTPIDIQP